MVMLFSKQISLAKIPLISFSRQDRRIAKEIWQILNNSEQTSNTENYTETQELLKREHWLANGIQRFNINPLVYLTSLMNIFFKTNSTAKREILAGEIAQFIADVNQKSIPELNTAMLLLPQKIFIAYQNGDNREIVQAVNDFRQTFEQPKYAQNLLNQYRLNRIVNSQITDTQIKLLNENIQRRNMPDRPQQKLRRRYRNLNPVLRDSGRVVLATGITAGTFALLPSAIAYPELPLPGIFSNMLFFNLVLNTVSNSVMLWVSGNGLRVSNYRLSDLKGVKLSQSAMYSQLGLPLTQLISFGANYFLAAQGLQNPLLTKILVLLSVGIVGATYTFLNNYAIRGKSLEESKFNMMRPLAGSFLAMGITNIFNISAEFLTIWSKICDAAYRFFVEGILNYRAYRTSIWKDLEKASPKNFQNLSAKELQNQLFKFNIEATSFILKPGGISSVQNFLNKKIDTQTLIRLFQKLGQERSGHIANIQRHSYYDSQQAEDCFNDLYYQYRVMLAQAICKRAKLFFNPFDETRPWSEFKENLKNKSPQDLKFLRIKTLEALKNSQPENLNIELLKLGAWFGVSTLPYIRKYLNDLSEEKLAVGIADLLSMKFNSDERLFAKKILEIYSAILIKKTKREKQRHAN